MEQENRNRRIALAKKRRQRALMTRMIVFVILIVSVIGGAILIKKYGPSREKANLNKYYGITQENQLAITIDNEVIGAQGVLIQNEPYLEYSIVRDYLNGRFYLDVNENILLYTLPDGTIRVDVGSKEYTYRNETNSKDYVILKMEGNTAYIALKFVQEYTDIEYQMYEEPNRVMIAADWEEQTVATVKKVTQLRESGNVKSPILKHLARKSQVTIVAEEEGWQKVRTEDGFVGYMKKKHLKNQNQIVFDRDFEKQVYPNISKEKTINLAWQNVTGSTADSSVLEIIANSKGLTTIAPTWFTVANTEGKISSLASTQYVNYAHNSGIEVWAVVKDYEGGIDSDEETYELLSHTTHRENLINQLISVALRTKLDGINVNFERISEECGEHYMQFIRELSLKCRQNHIVLSVDNYVLRDDISPYYLKEQGEIVDYVVVMGFDEYNRNSAESGPVSSVSYVETGIEETLKVVPEEKVISAVPFFTRLWIEVPVSEEEIELSSKVYGMSGAQNVVANAGAEIVMDQDAGQSYAQWDTSDGATHKIWLEDEESLEAKLQLMKKYKLAGHASWRLGFEKSGVWELILKYVN